MEFHRGIRFSVHLRALRVSVVNKVLEFFLSLASHNSSGSCASNSKRHPVHSIGVQLEVGVDSRCREVLRSCEEFSSCQFVEFVAALFAVYWPRIPRISRKGSLRFGCHWFETQFFTVSPARLLDSHF